MLGADRQEASAFERDLPGRKTIVGDADRQNVGKRPPGQDDHTADRPDEPAIEAVGIKVGYGRKAPAPSRRDLLQRHDIGPSFADRRQRRWGDGVETQIHLEPCKFRSAARRRARPDGRRRDARRRSGERETRKSVDGEDIGGGGRARDDRGAEDRLTSEDRSRLIPVETLQDQPHLEMHTRGG